MKQGFKLNVKPAFNCEWSWKLAKASTFNFDGRKRALFNLWASEAQRAYDHLQTELRSSIDSMRINGVSDSEIFRTLSVSLKDRLDVFSKFRGEVEGKVDDLLNQTSQLSASEGIARPSSLLFRGQDTAGAIVRNQDIVADDPFIEVFRKASFATNDFKYAKQYGSHVVGIKSEKLKFLDLDNPKGKFEQGIANTVNNYISEGEGLTSVSGGQIAKQLSEHGYDGISRVFDDKTNTIEYIFTDEIPKESIIGEVNEPGEGLVWALDPTVQEHCSTCLTNSGHGSDSFDHWASIGLPGMGTTECGIYCRCSLEREGAQT